MTIASLQPTPRAGRLVAVSAALAPLVFLISEAISATAWSAGTYDYGHNFISDLGTTVCGSTFAGRIMCSPLHGVMNVGFVVMGVGVAVAVALLARRLPGARRALSTVFGCLVAVGMILVATVHGGVESVDNGTIAIHALGAAAAIALGNVLAIIMGTNARRLGFPRWYSRAAVALGTIGLVGLILLLSGSAVLDPAVFERISVYAIFVWLFLTSAAQLTSSRTGGSAHAS